MRIAVLVLALLTALPAVALARAPKLEELPTVEGILERAQKQIAEEREAALVASRDEKMDLIKAYEDGKVSLYEAMPIVDILKDDKEEAKYRVQASLALRARFKDLPANDDRLKKLKKQIGAALLSSLNDGNEEVRVWVAAVFKTFWFGEYQRIGFDPKDSYAKRGKAYQAWRKFLSK